jgi:ribosomal protein L11 methylase PrmA
LGANTGLFSRIASTQGIDTIAWDIDPGAVELNYRQLKKDRDQNLLPLVIDLTNPSPAIGWANSERLSFIERANADLILALALIHHLAIGNNLPLADIAQFLSQLAEWLIIEFVPKDDPKVQTLLATREDIFPGYNQSEFEAVFSSCFQIVQSEQVKNTHRVVYLMQRRGNSTS